MRWEARGRSMRSEPRWMDLRRDVRRDVRMDVRMDVMREVRRPSYSICLGQP